MRRRNRITKPKAALPAPVELTIDKFSHDGRGIAYHQGRVVMVRNALPGEVVLVKIEQARMKLWQGVAVKFEQQSDRRIAPHCDHFGTCGGCQQQHITHDTQLELKQQSVTEHFERAGLEIQQWADPLVSQPFEYRHRARFHVDKAGVIGFYEEKKNTVVAIEHCPVLRPELDRVFQKLRAEAPLQGIVEVELVVDDKGTVGLKVGNGESSAVDALLQWAQVNGLSVEDPLMYLAGKAEVLARVGDFTQVNREINQQMIEQAKQWLALSKDDVVLDLFCGNGNFSLALAPFVTKVIGLEGSHRAIVNANSASEDVPNASFEVCDLFLRDVMSLPDVVESMPSVVVLDPPRAGAEALAKGISKVKKVSKILYVSCDPATLTRDLRYFQQAKWHITKAGLVDMFPQTKHIETMVLLER